MRNSIANHQRFCNSRSSKLLKTKDFESNCFLSVTVTNLLNFFINVDMQIFYFLMHILFAKAPEKCESSKTKHVYYCSGRVIMLFVYVQFPKRKTVMAKIVTIVTFPACLLLTLAAFTVHYKFLSPK